MFIPFKSPQETSDQPNSSKVVVNGVSPTVDVKECAQTISSISKANEALVETQPTEVKSAKSAEESESEPREKSQERTGDVNDESFIVTPDYIQQSKSSTNVSMLDLRALLIFVVFTSHCRIYIAIRNALKQENLNPEIEEKLLNLQRYQEKQMKSETHQPAAVTEPQPNSASHNKKRPTSRMQDDDDWQLDLPKRRTKNHAHSDRSSIGEHTPTKAAHTVADEPSIEASPVNNRRAAAIKRESEKKKQQQQIQVGLVVVFIYAVILVSRRKITVIYKQLLSSTN